MAAHWWLFTSLTVTPVMLSQPWFFKFTWNNSGVTGVGWGKEISITTHSTINACHLSKAVWQCALSALKYACPFALEIPLLGLYPEEIMKNVHKYLPTRKLTF